MSENKDATEVTTRRKKRSGFSFSTYIHRIFTHCRNKENTSNTISAKSMSVLNSSTLNTARSVLTECETLMKSAKKATLDGRDVEVAFRLVLGNNEVFEKCRVNADNVIRHYNSVAPMEQKYSSGKRGPKRPDETKAGRAVRMMKPIVSTGLFIPYGRMKRFIKKNSNIRRVSTWAMLSLAGYLESLYTDILYGVIDYMVKNKLTGKRITPRHLKLSISKDDILRNAILKPSLAFAASGVVPHIPSAILSKQTEKIRDAQESLNRTYTGQNVGVVTTNKAMEIVTQKPTIPRRSASKQKKPSSTDPKTKSKSSKKTSKKTTKKKSIIDGVPPGSRLDQKHSNDSNDSKDSKNSKNEKRNWVESEKKGDVTVKRQPLKPSKRGGLKSVKEVILKFYEIMGVTDINENSLFSDNDSDKKVDEFWSTKCQGINGRPYFTSLYLYNLMFTAYNTTGSKVELTLWTIKSDDKILSFAITANQNMFKKSPLYNKLDNWDQSEWKDSTGTDASALVNKNILKNKSYQEVVMICAIEPGAGKHLLEKHILPSNVHWWAEIADNAAYNKVWSPLGFSLLRLYDTNSKYKGEFHDKTDDGSKGENRSFYVYK